REHHTNVCPEICPAFWAAFQITQPVVELFDSDSGDWTRPKVCAEFRQTLFQIGNVRRTHPILALRFQHFFRQFLNGYVAPSDALQVIEVKDCCVLDGLAVFSEFFAGLDDCGEFTAGRPIASRPWRSRVVIWRSRSAFRLGFGLEKLPASIKRTKIEIPGMRLAVAIFEDSKGWPLHGRKYSQKRLRMSA